MSAVLQTPEHSGRVRGVGGFVTPTAYFNLPKGKRVRITKAELLARDRVMAEEMEKSKLEMESARKEMDKSKQDMENTKAELLSEILQLKAMLNSSNLSSPLLSDKGSRMLEKVQSPEEVKCKPAASKGLVMEKDFDDDCAPIDPPPPNPQNKVTISSCQLCTNCIHVNSIDYYLIF